MCARIRWLSKASKSGMLLVALTVVGLSQVANAAFLNIVVTNSGNPNVFALGGASSAGVALMGQGTSNAGNLSVAEAFVLSGGSGTAPVSIYKGNNDSITEDYIAKDYLKTTYVSGNESGMIEWSPEPNVPSKTFTVSHVLVRDGNNSPYWALFAINPVYGLSSVSTGINFSGFWAGVQGSISHVELGGTSGPGGNPPAVPEPTSILIWLSASACGVGLTAYRKRKKLVC